MTKITWNQFENTCQNPHDDFEYLCRIFFKHYFIKDPLVNLVQIPSNPGIETDPYCVNGELIGFQAKYFSGNISYSDILDSARKTVKYYSKKIDKVIIFCNKDINEETKNYTKTKNILNEAGIEVISFCNHNLLDAISTSKEYGKIKELFFNDLNLNNEWFSKRLKSELESLVPRYISGFHVENDDLEKQFEILYRSKEMFNMLEAMIIDWKNRIKDIYNVPNELKISFANAIDLLEIPTRENIEQIFNWKNQFSELKNTIDATYDDLKKERDKNAHANQISLKDKNELVIRKYYAYKDLKKLIEEIDLSHNKYFKYINKNLLFIEGDVGTGKSHLLGYESEKHGNNVENKTILLLGQKLIFDKEPSKQIMEELKLPDKTFEQFLDCCEAKGEINGCITVIMLDAINECAHHKIWKNYINSILESVQSLKFVKFVCTIRSTYKKNIFNDSLLKKFEDKTIPLMKHQGFKNILAAAVPKFFNKYNIPISVSASFNSEFQNPLFLQTYCEVYEEGYKYGSKSIFSLYLKYINKEVDKIKDNYEIDVNYPYGKEIMNRIGEYFFTNNERSITYVKLVEMTNDIPNVIVVIQGLLKSNIIVSFVDIEDTERVYIGYERFADFIEAKYVLELTNNLQKLKEFIITNILSINNNEDLSKYNAIGVFVALSLLAKEKYGDEIIDCLQTIPIKQKDKFKYLRSEIVSEYIKSYNVRSDKDINSKDYFELVYSQITTKGNMLTHIELMVTMAGRDNQLNVSTMTNWLYPMLLVDRDYYWTIYINSKYVDGDGIFNIIQYFLNGDLNNVNNFEKSLYSQELVWFLSSSNRSLRDKASRALIRLLDIDIKIMMKLLKIFIGVNDPYIISRLFGCVYGSLLKADSSKLNSQDLLDLAKWIYTNIFDKNEVYTDILLRDYACNIIEYILYLDIDIKFDVEKCRPPYNSSKIIPVSLKELNHSYPNEVDNKHQGTSLIKNSMNPNFKIEHFCESCGYGNFGRYVFEHNLKNFKEVNKVNVFSYAFNYIIKDLGYDNKLFTQYDCSMSFGMHIDTIERIGKKYQWMAMYHTLAIVSDHFGYIEEYSDISHYSYRGTWNPYIRDFDPTLSIENDENNLDIGIKLLREEYRNWDLNNSNWAKNLSDAYEFKSLVEMTDNKNNEWIALQYFFKDDSPDEYNKAHQSIYKDLSAYLIHSNEVDNFILKVKDKNFWDNDINIANINNRYEIFAKEYTWSPAFKDEYVADSFSEIKMEVLKKNSIKKYQELISKSTNKIVKIENEIPDDTKSDNISDTDMKGNIDEVEETIIENIGKLLPCYYSYLWENEYDYSKDEPIVYSIPNNLLINSLNLIQSNDGVWTCGGEIVCVDFSHVKGSNVEGLYIKKEIIDDFLNKNNLSLVWIGTGEKTHSSNPYVIIESIYSQNSALVYRDSKGKLTETNHTNLY